MVLILVIRIKLLHRVDNASVANNNSRLFFFKLESLTSHLITKLCQRGTELADG